MWRKNKVSIDHWSNINCEHKSSIMGVWESRTSLSLTWYIWVWIWFSVSWNLKFSLILDLSKSMSGSWCPSHLCSWGLSSLIVTFRHVFRHETCSLLTHYIPMEKWRYWITWHAQHYHLIFHITITNSISYTCSCLFDSVFLWYINRRVYTLYPTTHLFPCPWLEHRPGFQNMLDYHGPSGLRRQK